MNKKGDIIIKKEDGKEVAYEVGFLGNRKIGELHEKWNGSKETRNFFGTNVRLESKGTLQINDFKGSVIEPKLFEPYLERKGTFKRRDYDFFGGIRDYPVTFEQDKEAPKLKDKPRKPVSPNNTSDSYSESQSTASPTLNREYEEREMSWQGSVIKDAAHDKDSYKRFLAARQLNNPFVLYMMVLHDKENDDRAVYELCQGITYPFGQHDNFFYASSALLYNLALEKKLDKNISDIVINSGLSYLEDYISYKELAEKSVNDGVRRWAEPRNVRHLKFFNFFIWFLNTFRKDNIPIHHSDLSQPDVRISSLDDNLMQDLEYEWIAR